jgi:hypothetical protein
MRAVVLNQKPRKELSMPNAPSPDEEGPRNQVERRRQPFVPDVNRVVPVDPALSARYARDKFMAEVSILVGAQLTDRIIQESGDLEDKIRERARDGAHYGLMSQVHISFVVQAARLRDRFMEGGGEEPGFQR